MRRARVQRDDWGEEKLSGKRNCDHHESFGMRFVRECEVGSVRTIHDPQNSLKIAMNKKLGYVEGDWDLS